MLAELAARGSLFWLRVAAIIMLGMLAAQAVGGTSSGLRFRYRVYQLLEGLKPRPSLVERTVLVLVDDDDYWKGGFGRRVPVKRDYLGGLIVALAQHRPRVIGVDFDLRAPVPSASGDHGDYKDETLTFVRAIERAASMTRVVLPVTVWKNSRGEYIREAEVYQPSLEPGKVANIDYGYIALPHDLRKVPLSLDLATGERIKSFAQALAEAYNPATARPLSSALPLPFGSYVTEGEFSTATASEVLRGDPSTIDRLTGKVVIVGGNWHELAYGRGRRVDGHETPAGAMSGVFVHANHVEAILDRRTYRAVTEVVGWVVEVGFIFAAAAAFALRRTVGWKLRRLGGLSLLLLGLGYVLLQNLGIVFEVAIPLALLILHSLVDRALEWREAALRCEREHGLA